MLIRILVQPVIPEVVIRFIFLVYPPDKILIHNKIRNIKQSKIFHTVSLYNISSRKPDILLVFTEFFFETAYKLAIASVRKVRCGKY